MSPAIVAITEEHIEGFRAALDSVAREHRYLAFLEAPPIEQVREYIEGNILAGHPHFVALAEGRLVGWCDVVPNKRPTLAHSGVLGIGLIEAFRSRGLGTALMQTAIDAAFRKGLTRIELTVRKDNIRARRLYEKLGFEVEGLVRRHMRVGDRYYDSFLMSLLRD